MWEHESPDITVEYSPQLDVIPVWVGPLGLVAVVAVVMLVVVDAGPFTQYASSNQRLVHWAATLGFHW